MIILKNLLIFSAVIVGINCFEWSEIGGSIEDEVKAEIGAIAAPIVQLKTDLADLAVLTKAKISNIGLSDVGQIMTSVGGSDACTKLTDDTNTAYQFASNVTQFAVSAVEEVTSALNKIVDCTNELLVNQLKCVMDNIQIVRQDILDLQTKAKPYKDETAQIYQNMLTDYKNCLKEW